MSTTTKTYLRVLHLEVPLDATSGTETFASSGLFTAGIYGVTLPAENKATEPAKANVYKMIEDGAYSMLFDSLGDAGKGEFSESQVVEFCRKNRDKLRKGGYGTFFRLKGGFVAGVSVNDVGLFVSVDPFSDVHVWNARFRHHAVSLQLEP